MMISFLALIGVLGLLAGFGAFGTTELVRKLPGIEPRVIEGFRPWACDLCMALWTSLVMLFAICTAWRQSSGQLASIGTALVAWPISIGIALCLLYWSHTAVPEAPIGIGD